MYDIVIIGSGPAGLSAAIYGLRAGKKLVVIEKDYEGTGQIALGSHVDNYPGIPNISGIELGNNLRNHALGLGTKFIEAIANKITKNSDGSFAIEIDKAGETEVIETNNIIYAAGASHRKLGVAGEEELQGMGVSYCATCDGALYQDADVIVVGGGNTAVDDALYLADIAANVTLLHRRDVFRASAASLEKLKEKSNVTIITNVNIKKIEGEDEVTGVVVDNGEVINAEGIFIAVGMEPQTSLVESLVTLDDAGYILAGEDGKSSCEGLYAAGDVRSKKLRQVVTAVSDGANCINSILCQ